MHTNRTGSNTYLATPTRGLEESLSVHELRTVRQGYDHRKQTFDRSVDFVEWDWVLKNQLIYTRRYVIMLVVLHSFHRLNVRRTDGQTDR